MKLAYRLHSAGIIKIEKNVWATKSVKESACAIAGTRTLTSMHYGINEFLVFES